MMHLLLLSLLGCADKAAATDSAGSDAGDDSSDAGPDFDCPAPTPGFQDINTTPASPYLMVHPTVSADEVNGHILVFLAGGPGDSGSANIGFNAFLSRGGGVGNFISVMPYTTDGDLSDEGERIAAVVDEVLACYGGEAGEVHLAGTSNGGRAAFGIMLEQPEHFATLLGAPGYFVEGDSSVLSAQLAGKAVFNGVGALDDESWQTAVSGTHDTLTALGVESVYDVFEGQGHIPDETFDPSPLFDFWLSHGR